ncbi:uncharacterized protein LOC103874581 isoform X2 [Brassica rapa]|uniref:uncharacterized protein LOC103874581 isoform X2 n=1 Tax=Brassica campestris TaxID=3711 RepID=UPI00142E3E91|nr:uncharacterized protein LOC103874581 isoform X2 [Brassica rapa]
MPVSLKRNMNVEIREMISRDPWSLKQPIHVLGIIFALVAFICVLEFLVIPSQGHLSTNLRFLVSGACLLTWASTLSRSYAFYCICSHLYGLFMASFLLFYQVVKRLPKKLSSSAVFLYSTLIGLTVVSLPYIPGWFEVIRETYALTRKFRNVGELAIVINTRLFETQFGLIAINSELLLAYDGSIDIGISRVMSWFIGIWAAVLILQSSEDTRFAVGALVCVLVVSPLLRMITRLIFPDCGILMAKLLIMRDAIRDAVGPFVWSFIILHIYSRRVKEEFVRSYGKSVRKKMKMKMKKRLETSVTVGESHTLVSHFPTPPRIKFSSGKGPGPDARVVYIAGAFDLFHAGHVGILRRARELGDFLLVGIAKRGGHPPIMSMQERILSVGACRYVDEVIFGAPWEVSKITITFFGISLVVHGTVAESDNFQRKEENPYAVPISMGIFQILESPLNITTSTIMGRIVANHEAYQKRNLKKEASDDKQMEKEASYDKQMEKEASDDKQKGTDKNQNTERTASYFKNSSVGF